MNTPLEKIKNSYSNRLKNNHLFGRDAQNLKQNSLKDLIQNDLPDPEEAIDYISKNHRLNPLYRRFVSPRRFLGKFIDRIKNKFYYETHHFIGAIIDKQEKINLHTASAIKSLDQNQKHLSNQLTAINSNLNSITESITNLKDQLASEIQENRSIISLHSSQLNELTTQATQHQLRHTELFERLQETLAFLSTKIKSIHQNHKKNSEEITALDQSVSKRIHHLRYPILDFNYVGFEKTFYGDHESLQPKHSQYMDHLQGLDNILDIGCGSGAFLTLLKKKGLQAKGIDINPNVIKDCAQHDLDVERADAIPFLTKQPNNTFGAISCFHVIEHMHPEDCLKFLRLCFKKIRRGGKLLLETPNITMLGILNHGFYMDPTHIRPVHPETIEFVLKDLGFSKIKTHTSSRLPEGDRLKEVSDPQMNSNFQKLNKLLFGDQDISIIAKK